MVEIKELLDKIKFDITFIHSVEFGDYKGSDCMCKIAFKSLCDVAKPWNAHLIDIINDFIEDYDAILEPYSTSKNLIVLFKVKLS